MCTRQLRVNLMDNNEFNKTYIESTELPPHKWSEKKSELVPDRAFYYDARLPQLGLTVTSSGSRSYHVRATVGGKTKRHSIPRGKYTGMIVAVARVIERKNESGTQHTKPEQQYRRLHLAKLAQELISGQPEEFRSASQLANELYISPRALRKLFNDIFQISPYQYMLSYRLQCVRHELNCHSASASTISSIATKYGFDELGRFSQYYCRMYGELPSATLKAQ